MKKLLTRLSSPSDIAWLCIKVSLIFFWLANMFVMLSDLSPLCPFPVSFCTVYSFSPFFSPLGKILLSVLLVLLSLLYILEIETRYVTLVQFVVSCIIITYHESNGMFHHATIFSPIFAVQSIAYWLYHKNKSFDLSHFRAQYCIQIIAATYMLAGISKLATSGISWIDSGQTFPLQILKNYSFMYFADGNRDALDHGYNLANAIFKQQHLVIALLSLSLLLELCCFVAIISQRVRWVYAIGLLAMHIGIKVVMGISFGVIVPVMAIFFLNPLYLILYPVTKKAFTFKNDVQLLE